MLIRRYILLLVTALFWHVATAQQITLHGIVFKYNSSQRISQALVTNLHTNSVMMSDELGIFSINALPGDTLLLSAKGYGMYKYAVSGSKDVVLYMQPVSELKEVTVKGQTEKQELNEVMGEYRSQGIFYDGKPPLWSFLTSPVTGFYELLGKTPNDARRFKIFSNQELEHDEVTKRYTKELVKRVTGLPDTDVVKFMDSYTPSYEDMKEWDDYQLIVHIKKYLEYYKKHGDVPIQKLY